MWLLATDSGPDSPVWCPLAKSWVSGRALLSSITNHSGPLKKQSQLPRDCPISPFGWLVDVELSFLRQDLRYPRAGLELLILLSQLPSTRIAVMCHHTLQSCFVSNLYSAGAINICASTGLWKHRLQSCFFNQLCHMLVLPIISCLHLWHSLLYISKKAVFSCTLTISISFGLFVCLCFVFFPFGTEITWIALDHTLPAIPRAWKLCSPSSSPTSSQMPGLLELKLDGDDKAQGKKRKYRKQDLLGQCPILPVVTMTSPREVWEARPEPHPTATCSSQTESCWTQ